MSDKSFNLYLEIKGSNLIFYIQENDAQNNPKIKYKLNVPTIGLEDNKIINFEKVFDTIKKKYLFSRTKPKMHF